VIVSVGMSHRDAPIELREKLAVDRDAMPELLARLVALPGVGEAACVSTCNRIEVYAAASGTTDEAAAQAAERIGRELDRLATERGGAPVLPRLQRRTGRDAVHHLFRVAASLDSLVVGEPQILGQVKTAFELAREAGTTGRWLERGLSRALHAAKRVRTETHIGEGQVSIASTAVDLARHIFEDLAGKTTLLVGAGEMAEAAARLLQRHGARLVVVNRSPERARALAEEMGGTSRPFAELRASLVDADVVVSSTSARGFVIDREMVAGARKARRGRSLFLIDIAVPRDVEPSVNELDDTYLYDVDDLSQIVEESMRGRRFEAHRAEEIVREEAARFESWAGALQVTPTIVALRAKARAALGAEVERSLAGRLKHLGDAEREALAVMVDAAVNRLLHVPVTRLKGLAADARGDEAIQLVHALFDLPQVVRGDLAEGGLDAELDEDDAPVREAR
jgi:glutamyl-tRNA reductase